MLAECLALVERLRTVIDEETRRLTAGEAPTSLEALAAEKSRLTDQLEAAQETLKRSGRAALLATDPTERARLRDALAAFNAAVAENGRVVARKKELSEGLIEAVVAEARRQSGAAVNTYAPAGAGPAKPRAAALAFNATI